MISWWIIIIFKYSDLFYGDFMFCRRCRICLVVNYVIVEITLLSAINKINNFFCGNFGEGHEKI